jgi:dihydrofolate synthase/folylpolyglutamate synthase
MTMFGLNKFGDGICFPRILRFYREFGIDVGALAARSIAVTGSNGKGSTARFAAAALKAEGLSAGLFTSPHLFHVRERFVLDDVAIPQEDFDRHAATVLAFAKRLADNDRMGAFEFLFLTAILWFEEKRPDAIVWEAGIGGRYDPIRTVRARVSALTSIELEHTPLLGATEELIACDKIDALAPGGALVVSPSVPADLRAAIEGYCRLGDKHPLFVADDLAVTDVENAQDGTSFRVDGQPHSLRLIGGHQIDNALTAAHAAREWLGKKQDPVAFLGALREVSWAGRLERVAENPDLWIDVGHTPGAVDRVTSAFLDFCPREKTLVVFGVSLSKDIEGIATLVSSRFDHFILTSAKKAGADVDTFREVFRGHDAAIEHDISAAARRARDRAAKENWTVLAIGGLFLAVEFEHAWRGGDPKELEFL